MSDDKNLNAPDTEEKSEPKETVSALHNAREMKAQAAREAELAERERQAESAEEAYQAREEYAKELNEEKVALMQLKQGVLEDTEKVFGQKEESKKYTIWQKISNWFYHSKWWLGIATFCVLIGGFLIYDYVTRVDPDITLMMLSANGALTVQEPQIIEMLKKDCPDYNEDGEVVAEIVSIPLSRRNMESATQLATAYMTQLSVQFRTDMCMLVFVDEEAEEYLDADNQKLFVDLEKIFPQYECVEKYRVKLDNTSFAEKIGLEGELGKGSYLALRTYDGGENEDKMKAAYARALPILESILKQISTEGV